MKANWPLMKREYAQSEQPISLAELAVKHNITKRAVEEHSRNEGWPEARVQFFSETASKVHELGVERTAKRKTSQLEDVERAFDTLVTSITAIGKRVSSPEFQAQVGGIEVEKVLERQASLSAAMDKLGRLIQLLKGSPDSRVAVDLAALLSGTEEKEPQ